MAEFTSAFSYRGNRSSTANVNIARSSSFWHSCPWHDILAGDIEGCAHYFDFTRFKPSSNINAAEAYWDHGLHVFGSNGGAIADLDANGGGKSFASDGDDEGASCHQLAAPYQIDRATQEFWFEALIKTSTIADTKHGFFVGLADTTAFTATVPIAAAGTLADLNFVGFHRLEGDGDMLDTVYKANGVTQVTVKADAVTLVADTYIKVGMHFKREVDEYVQATDPNRKNLFTFFQNGVRLADYKQVPSAQGTDFPNDIRMGFAFAVLNATGSSPGTSSVRWARLAQLL